MEYLKNSVVICLSNLVLASPYVDLSGGLMHRDFGGDVNSYKSQQSLLAGGAIGYKWKNFDFAIDGLYSIGRQKGLGFNLGDASIDRDDYTWHSIDVGPTLKYHMKMKSSNWTYAPFVGVFYNHSIATNSAKLRDSVTNEVEDLENVLWGYGAKIGVEYQKATPESTWMESINYKFFAAYTRYIGLETEYLDGGSITKYNGDVPDKLMDYSVGFTVGISLGEKLFKKTKNTLLGLRY